MNNSNDLNFKINTIWIISIMAILIVALMAYIIVGKSYCPKELIKYISAFASMLSILLSIFAIAFTYHASRDTNRHLDNLTEKAFGNPMQLGNNSNDENTTLPENKAK